MAVLSVSKQEFSRLDVLLQVQRGQDGATTLLSRRRASLTRVLPHAAAVMAGLAVWFGPDGLKLFSDDQGENARQSQSLPQNGDATSGSALNGFSPEVGRSG